jgi:hypothetical protein
MCYEDADTRTGYFNMSYPLFRGKPIGVLGIRGNRHFHLAMDDGLYLLPFYRDRHFGRVLWDIALFILQGKKDLRHLQKGFVFHRISADVAAQRLNQKMIDDYSDAVTYVRRDATRSIQIVRFDLDKVATNGASRIPNRVHRPASSPVTPGMRSLPALSAFTDEEPAENRNAPQNEIRETFVLYKTVLSLVVVREIIAPWEEE